MKAVVIGLFLMFFASAPTVEAGTLVTGSTLVEGVSFSSRSDGGGFVIRIETTGLVNAFRSPRPYREHGVELILYNVELSERLDRAAPKGPVQEYSIVSDDGHVYIRLMLKPSARVDVEAYRDRTSTDLLVNLSYAGTPMQLASTSPGTSGSGSQSAPSGFSRWKLDTIILDAGHGGHDTGTNHHGIEEEDVVLDVTMRVGALIQKFMPDVKVVYTRTSDRFVTLRDRGHIANQAGGKLFISIHANAARNSSARGSETYFLGMHRSESAERVMERENEVVRLEENQEHYEQYDQQALILRTMAQSTYMKKSQELAGLIQHQFNEEAGRPDRGVKQAGFLVLWAASMPAVLVELGFVSNPAEGRYLASESGKSEMSAAIFRAVRDFKEQYDNDLASAVPN